MSSKNEIAFSKYKIKNREYKDFFNKNEWWKIVGNIKLKDKGMFLILYSKSDPDFLYISNVIDRSLIEILFTHSAVLDNKENIINKNTYWKENLIFKEIKDIDKYKIFIFENFYKNPFLTNVLYKEILIKNYNSWYLSMFNYFQIDKEEFLFYNCFLDKKNKENKKNIFFLMNYFQKGFDNLNYEQDFNIFFNNKSKEYQRARKIEKIWNELAEKKIDIYKITDIQLDF